MGLSETDVKRILITGAGGAPVINFVRSLRMAEEPLYLIGVDSSEFHLARAETDERHLVPLAHETDYLPVLRDIICETGAQMVFAQPDAEIAILSELRDELGTITFWPRRETVALCHNKYETYRRWREAGLRVPETRLLRGPGDLEDALRDFGDVWLRAAQGAAGKGSFHTGDLAQAKMWVEFSGGWGGFTAAQYLSPHSVTWQTIWNKGDLVVAQGRKRLYWEFADRTPSGITGITGGGMTIADEQVDEISLRAIMAIDREPHGVFSADLTYDSDGVPNPTEINIGRFFTTHLFFTTAGLNMPYILVKLAFGEDVPHIARRVNPLSPGLVWIRGMDIEPVLTEEGALRSMGEELQARRARLLQPHPAKG